MEAMMVEQLSAKARQTALDGLPGWSEAAGGNAIARKFTFKDFNEAFGFMSRAALVAVEVLLSTHDAGGVTARDIDLAKAMNAIAAQLGAH
jgi:4a-hydroxytetrahydrobiopterin dehydratase